MGVRSRRARSRLLAAEPLALQPLDLVDGDAAAPAPGIVTTSPAAIPGSKVRLVLMPRRLAVWAMESGARPPFSSCPCKASIAASVQMQRGHQMVCTPSLRLAPFWNCIAPKGAAMWEPSEVPDTLAVNYF